MKFINNLITLIAVLATLSVSFSSCKEDEIAATEVMRKKLMTKTWLIKSVSVDGTDRTNLFQGLTLKFGESNYEVTGSNVIWSTNGTWSFTDDTGKTFKRNDDVVVTIESATETSLVLKLTWQKNTFGPGRADSIVGSHTFTFE